MKPEILFDGVGRVEHFTVARNDE